MDIMDILARAGGIDQIASETGVSPAIVQQGAAALLPAILGGFKNQAQQQPGGLDGLIGMLGGMGGAGMLENVLGAQPTNTAAGGNVLGQIFGSGDVTNAVAQDAAQKTGIDMGTIMKLLPYLAMAVSGYMAYKHSQQGGAAPAGGSGLDSILGNILGGGTAASQAAPAGAGMGGMGGLGRMLDMDGDGNPLDDIIGMAGRMGIGR